MSINKREQWIRLVDEVMENGGLDFNAHKRFGVKTNKILWQRLWAMGLGGVNVKMLVRMYPNIRERKMEAHAIAKQHNYGTTYLTANAQGVKKRKGKGQWEEQRDKIVRNTQYVKYEYLTDIAVKIVSVSRWTGIEYTGFNRGDLHRLRKMGLSGKFFKKLYDEYPDSVIDRVAKVRDTTINAYFKVPDKQESGQKEKGLWKKLV